MRPPAALERREVQLLAVLAVVALAQGWSGAAITHTLPFVQEQFGWTDTNVFDVLALTRAVALLALFLSYWSDHRGRRMPLLLGFALIPMANIVTAAFPSPAVYAAAQSIGRIGTIAVGALAVVVIAEELNPAARSYAVGIYALVGSMGTGLGLILRNVGAISPGAWRWVFLLSAIPLLALPIVVARLSESRAFVAHDVRPPLTTVLRAPHASRFWPMAGLSMVLAMYAGPAANFALVRLENALGWSEVSASALLALTSAPGVAIGLLAGGRAADIVGRKPTERISILLGVGGGLVFYFSEGGWLMGLGIFISTLGASAFGPAFGSHRAELFPTTLRATAGAWITNAAIIGSLAGFVIGRFVVETYGVPVTVAVLGGVLVAASTLIGLLPETKGAALIPPEDLATGAPPA